MRGLLAGGSQLRRQLAVALRPISLEGRDQPGHALQLSDHDRELLVDELLLGLQLAASARSVALEALHSRR